MKFVFGILGIWAFGTFFILMGLVFAYMIRSLEGKSYSGWTWIFHIAHMIVSWGICGIVIYVDDGGTIQNAIEEDGAPFFFVIFLAGVIFFLASIRVMQGKKPFPKINFRSQSNSTMGFNWKKWVLAPVIVFIITSFIGYYAFDITPSVTLQFGGTFSIFSIVVNVFASS